MDPWSSGNKVFDSPWKPGTPLGGILPAAEGGRSAGLLGSTSSSATPQLHGVSGWLQPAELQLPRPRSGRNTHHQYPCGCKGQVQRDRKVPSRNPQHPVKSRSCCCGGVIRSLLSATEPTMRPGVQPGDFHFFVVFSHL